VTARTASDSASSQRAFVDAMTAARVHVEAQTLAAATVLLAW
jgi:hypothetical protein